jgi:hypothetical protein
VKHVLIVANQTLGGQDLLDAVAERIRQGPCRFTLLVPAGAPPRFQILNDVAAGAGYGTLAADATLAAAHKRLEHGLASIRAAGAMAEGSVVPHEPVGAVREMNEQAHFDEIIVSTLPPGLSRWLHLDVPHRIERACHHPVTVITAGTSPSHV